MFERFQTFLKQFQAQASAFLKGLTLGRRIALGAGVAAVFLGLIALTTYSPAIRYVDGYSNLSQEDQTAILANLKKNNVTDFKLSGDTLSFPESRSLEIKMLLAQDGLPNSGVGVGWEKFDERAFGMTDFDQRVNKVRAVQGELQRTINKLDPVENSRVHIVMPDSAVFKEDKKPTTASISLKLRSGKSLSQKQIQGVLHLVARAVEGLDPVNIAIVDQDGNMLTKPDEEDGGLDAVTASQRQFQRRVEQELEGKIKEILNRAVGHNKVVAKVQAEIEFKKVETTISDVDPERSAVISSQRTDQSSQGSGMNPTGVPGAKSNLPAEKDDVRTGSGSGTTTTNNQETLNYEVKKTMSRIVEPVGNVRKLSTAVLVDGKMVDGKYLARSPEELAMITKLVKNAIGFEDNRDSISVETSQFEPDEYALAEKATESAQKTSLLQTGIFATVAIMAMIFLYFGIVKPYFRWLIFDPDKRSSEEFGVVDYELERSTMGARRVQIAEDIPFEKLSPKEQIMYLAKNDPAKTTEALRALLSPNHSHS